MTESVNSPATQPIQDKAPKPPGLMPKNVQTWAMLGLAVLMVSIMWLTGGKKPQTLPKSGTSAVQTPAPLEVNEGKIAELQNRIQDLQREQQVALNQQNKFFGAIQSESQTATPAQVAGTAQPPPATASRSDSGRTEEKSIRLAVFVECRLELQEGPSTAGIGSGHCLAHEQSVWLAGSASARTDL